MEKSGNFEIKNEWQPWFQQDDFNYNGFLIQVSLVKY